MSLIPSKYLILLRNRNFLYLTLINLFCQFAFAVLSLVLVSSSFDLTKNNFGVSAMLLSFAVPSLLMVAFAGLAADIFDRKIIIALAIFLIILIVFGFMNVLLSILWMIVLSLIYHLLIPIFLPAISAASAQVVRKNQLLVANSIFTLTVVGGQTGGLMAGSILQFFWGFKMPLIISNIFLIGSLFLVKFLPRLSPRRQPRFSQIPQTVRKIILVFLYVYWRKLIWFFMFFLGFVYGLYAFGVTIGPGFFEQILGIPIRASPLLVFPPIGLGLALGLYFLYQKPRVREGVLIALGSLAIGLSILAVGVVMGLGVWKEWWLILVATLVAVACFGAVVAGVAARTGLMRLIGHRYQGTVLAIIIILSAVAATVASPSAAMLVGIFGYVQILFFAGVVLTMMSLFFIYAANRWRF